jgi:hypothetical protein
VVPISGAKEREEGECVMVGRGLGETVRENGSRCATSTFGNDGDEVLDF